MALWLWRGSGSWVWIHRWAAREESPGHRHGWPTTQGTGERWWRRFFLLLLYIFFLCVRLCVCVAVGESIV